MKKLTRSVTIALTMLLFFALIHIEAKSQYIKSVTNSEVTNLEKLYNLNRHLSIPNAERSYGGKRRLAESSYSYSQSTMQYYIMDSTTYTYNTAANDSFNIEAELYGEITLDINAPKRTHSYDEYNYYQDTDGDNILDYHTSAIVVRDIAKRITRIELDYSLNSTTTFKEVQNFTYSPVTGKLSQVEIADPVNQINIALEEYLYDVNSLLASKAIYLYQNGFYKNYSRERYSYDLNARVVSVTVDTAQGINGWSEFRKDSIEYFYGGITTSTKPINIFSLKKNGNLWELETKVKYGGGGSAIIDTITHYEYSNNSFVPQLIKAYSFVLPNWLPGTCETTVVNGAQSTLTEYLYNGDNNPEAIYYSVKSGGGPWLKNSLKRYFYEVVSGGSEPEFQSSIITVYPNPNKGIIHFRSDLEEDFEVELFNSLGEQLLSEKKSTGEQLDISKAALGVYYIKITTGHSIASYKIVKE